LLSISSLACLGFALLAPACRPNSHADLDLRLTESKQLFEKGEFQAAIDSYDTLFLNYPDHGTVREDYLGILELIKQRAEHAFQAQRFVEAQTNFGVLLHNFPRFSGFAESLSFDRSYLSQRIAACRIAQTQVLAQQSYAEKEYLKALNAYHSLVRDYPNDLEPQKLLRAFYERLFQQANASKLQQEYSDAGRMYAALRAGYPTFKMKGGLSFTLKGLEAGLEECRMSLTRIGLELYRDEKLAEAIAAWDSLLVFDPDNKEIRKARENAAAQLKRIKKGSAASPL
jgi:tetratricopeptide (TPR) repeat protein